MHFEVNEAIKYGLDEAIMIYNLRYWILLNKSREKHYHDGKYWTYNTSKAFVEFFPFWNEQKIKRILISLKEQKVIITGNYNKSSYDRTNWYAFADDTMLKNEQSIVQKCTMESTNLNNGKVKNVQPIPNIKTNINTDVYTNSENQKKQTQKPDPFITNPLVTYFENEHQKIVGYKPYCMPLSARNKLAELNSVIPEFKKTIPAMLKELKNTKFNFKDGENSPTYLWLLENDNYVKMLAKYEQRKFKEDNYVYNPNL